MTTARDRDARRRVRPGAWLVAASLALAVAPSGALAAPAKTRANGNGGGGNMGIAVDVDTTRPAPDLARGRRLFRVRCVGCHGVDGKGDGPAARHIDPRPADLTSGKYKIRSTPQGSVPTNADIFRTITRGLPDTAMTGWLGLPAADRWQLVYYVKSLSPAFNRPAGTPIVVPTPTPVTLEAITKGEAIYHTLQCNQCHGAGGRGHGPLAKTLKDYRGNRVYPFNFSRSAKFKGGSSPRDLYRTIHTGLEGTPMRSFHGMLTEHDTWALVHYIGSLRADRPPPPVVALRDADTPLAKAAAAQRALAKAAADKAAADKAAADKAAADKAAADKAAADKAAADKAAAGSEQAKAAAAKAAADKAAADKAAARKAAAAAKAKARAAKRALAKKARALYRTRCAVCHGPRGRGDGPAAAGIRPTPRNFTDRTWQGATTNSRIEKAILRGGASVGKSAAMPPNPDLAKQPDMVKALRRIVRSFKK